MLVTGSGFLKIPGIFLFCIHRIPQQVRDDRFMQDGLWIFRNSYKCPHDFPQRRGAIYRALIYRAIIRRVQVRCVSIQRARCFGRNELRPYATLKSSDLEI